MTCEECGADFIRAKGRPKAFCSTLCQGRAAYRRRKESGRYAADCARRKARASYADELARRREQYQTDDEYRARKRAQETAKLRAQGVRPMYSDERRICPACGTEFAGCVSQVYCTKRCRGRAQRERLGWQSETHVLMCMASRFGAYFPKVKPVVAKVTVGVMIECPNCRSKNTSATSLTHRVCARCGTTVVLNADEVAWLTKQAAQRQKEAQRHG